jgi:NAD-dependent dihydropyrimidine dehydrogenase PreA subunit
MLLRNIVQIDEQKCDGCGLCVTSCAEGAIQVVQGKAKLVSDVYCDGLGACLGKCPRDAISVVQRPAAAFDEEATRRHLAGAKTGVKPNGCPGAMAQNLKLQIAVPPAAAARFAFSPAPPDGAPSNLVNWPIQLHLVPPGAAFLKGADLVLAADCVPFAYADFHRQIVRDRPLLIGCPKLDDVSAYVEKLAQILATAEIRRLTVVRMEVPCCGGLLRVAEAAKQRAGVDVPIEEITISIRGQMLAAQAAAKE